MDVRTASNKCHKRKKEDYVLKGGWNQLGFLLLHGHSSFGWRYLSKDTHNKHTNELNHKIHCSLQITGKMPITIVYEKLVGHNAKKMSQNIVITYLTTSQNTPEKVFNRDRPLHCIHHQHSFKLPSKYTSTYNFIHL